MTSIPDGEILYRYAHPDAFPVGQKEIPLAIFNDSELSCDWEKLQPTPEQSLHVKQGKTVLVMIKVCDAIRNPVNPKLTTVVIDAWKQNIIYDPQKEDPSNQFTPNDAHSMIVGKKKAAVATAIRENSEMRLL